MSFNEDVEGALRTLEPKFDCKGLALPRISKLVAPATKYDPHSASMFEGIEREAKDCPENIKVYFLGKAVSSYVFHAVNPDILRVILDGNNKLAEAKKHGFEEEWMRLKQPDYVLLMQICTLMATYGGLVFADEKHGRSKVKPIVEEINFRITARAVDDILAPKKDPTPYGSAEATKWYAKGHEWLPKIAKVKSRLEYEGLVRQACIDSVLL